MATPEPAPLATVRSRRRLSAGGLPASRLVPLGAAAVALSLVAAAGASSAPSRLESPRAADIARAPAAIRDTTLPVGMQRRVLARAAWWGGTYTAATGESVTVYISESYPEDPATGQRWADYLARLVHGSELSSVIAYLAPTLEVEAICGQDALACYGPDERMIVAPGEDPEPEITVEAILAHEYGHHVAANRSNAPWAALEYGTKRWASYVQVCAKTRRGELFPGSEDPLHYDRNPGEGFAESYRVLNQRRLGAAETPWGLVVTSLYPDDTALRLVEQDVIAPWVAGTTSSRTAMLTKAKGTRAYSVATPLDGTLKVSLRVPVKARYTLSVESPTGAKFARKSGTKSLSVETTICGQRSLRLRVSRVSGAGSFKLAIATP